MLYFGVNLASTADTRLQQSLILCSIQKAITRVLWSSPQKWKDITSCIKHSRSHSSNHFIVEYRRFLVLSAFFASSTFISLPFIWCWILWWRCNIPSSNFFSSYSLQWSTSTRKKSSHQHASKESFSTSIYIDTEHQYTLIHIQL